MMTDLQQLCGTLWSTLACEFLPAMWEQLQMNFWTLDFWVQAFILVTGLGGQYLIAKKRISGFYLWFAGNFAVIYTTFPRGMYGMAVLYAVYIGFNLYSIREWGKDEDQQESAVPEPRPQPSAEVSSQGAAA